MQSWALRKIARSLPPLAKRSANARKVRGASLRGTNGFARQGGIHLFQKRQNCNVAAWPASRGGRPLAHAGPPVLGKEWTPTEPFGRLDAASDLQSENCKPASRRECCSCVAIACAWHAVSRELAFCARWAHADARGGRALRNRAVLSRLSSLPPVPCPRDCAARGMHLRVPANHWPR